MARDRFFLRSCAAALLLALAAGAPVGRSLAEDTPDPAAAPVWAFDPAAPGPDRPPVGRSLFDQVFAAERGGTTVTEVPTPFAALRQHLLSYLGSESDESEVLAQVLIPLGRALQRNAAAPDHFASPRLVLAVVGDPPRRQEDGPPGAHGALGARLKDRLYIGYQEKAESLEVISYNEAAGRFEFQVVEDYAPGRRPRVIYARRPVCLACHQNGGPIFSEPPWSETNANAEIARRLAEEAPAFHGVAAQDGSRPFDQALVISTAVVKANLYGAYQKIWKDGCGDLGKSASALRCRAALLTAALQFKLSGGRHFDRRSRAYSSDLGAPLRHAWTGLWPAGLAIPRALIANRDPLTEGYDVTAAADPLRVRPPLDVWAGGDPGVLAAVAAGLAQLLPAAHAVHLDEALHDLAGDADPPDRLMRAPCAVSRRNLEGVGERYLFRCESEGSDSLLLNGHFYDRSQARLEGGIPWLAISDDAEQWKFEDLAIAAAALDLDNGRDGRTSVAFRPLNLRGGLRPRLPDGTAIETIALTWDAAIEDTADPSAEIPDHPANGEAVLTLVQDSTPMNAAVANLVRQAAQGAPNVLTDSTFRGGRAMAAVLAALGIGTDCCEDDRDLPPLALDRSRPEPAPSVQQTAAQQTDVQHIGVHRAFARFCAACHATAAPYPPNFLAGATSTLDATIARNGIALCAERIAFRLAMWDRPEEARAKSPMPPEAWLRGAGWSPEQWRDGAPRAALRDHLEGLLAEAGASIAQVDDRGRQAYEALPPCLEAAE